MPLPRLNQLQVNPARPATAVLQGMEFENRSRRTDIAEDRNAIMREGQGLQRESLEFNKKQAIFAQSRDFISSLEKEEFPKYKSWLEGIHPELAELLPDDVTDMPENEWNELKTKIEIGTDNVSKMDRLQLEEAMKTIREQTKRTQKLTDDAQAQKDKIELKKVPPGGGGFGGSVTTGPDGTTVSWGSGATVSPPTKTTVNAIQKDVVKIDDSIARVQGIVETYKGNYQKIQTRWGKKWDAFKDKTGLGTPLTGKDKKELAEYSTYRKRAVTHLGMSIHELAGGTLSKNEEKLYTQGLPNPGKGLIDGDSPIEFENALIDTYSNLLKSKARRMMYLKQGLTDGDVRGLLETNKQMSLAETMVRIDEFGEQKMQEIMLANPDLPEVDAKEQAKMFLKAEFGLEF
jgi:prefoldin subunit 5